MRKIKLKKKFKIFLCLYLIFLTSHLTIVTLSKYSSKVKTNAEIEVAKWDVSLLDTEESQDINIVSGNTEANYKLTVTSASDVATTYTIVLSNLPDGILVKLDDLKDFKTAVDGKIEFTNAGSFSADDKNKFKEHILTFSAPLGTVEVANNEVSLKVIFTQKKLN